VKATETARRLKCSRRSVHHMLNADADAGRRLRRRGWTKGPSVITEIPAPEDFKETSVKLLI